MSRKSHFSNAVISALFSVLLFPSCAPENKETKAQQQDRLFKQDHKEVLTEVAAMFKKDQAIRLQMEYGTADTLLIDSVRMAWGKRGMDIDSVLLIRDTFLVTAHYRDSLIDLMVAQDERHTKRLIELLNKYGYPESDRIDTTTKISPFLLFHHPSLKYKDTILSLLAGELKAKRIDTISYEMIKWDMGGREGLPDIKGMKVQHNKDGTTSITL